MFIAGTSPNVLSWKGGFVTFVFCPWTCYNRIPTKPATCRSLSTTKLRKKKKIQQSCWECHSEKCYLYTVQPIRNSLEEGRVNKLVCHGFILHVHIFLMRSDWIKATLFLHRGTYCSPAVQHLNTKHNKGKNATCFVETPSLETTMIFCCVNTFFKILFHISLKYIGICNFSYQVRDQAKYNFPEMINSQTECWMLQQWMTPILAYILQSYT